MLENKLVQNLSICKAFSIFQTQVSGSKHACRSIWDYFAKIKYFVKRFRKDQIKIIKFAEICNSVSLQGAQTGNSYVKPERFVGRNIFTFRMHWEFLMVD